jgi:hypothetical protein
VIERERERERILKYWATCCRTCKNGFITGSPFSSIAAKFPACTSNREAQTGQQVKTFLWNCDLYKLSAASVLQTHSNQLSGYTNATTKSIAARHINTQGVHKRCRFTSKSSCILLIRREWVQFVSQSVKTNNNDTMILWYYIKLQKRLLPAFGWSGLGEESGRVAGSSLFASSSSMRALDCICSRKGNDTVKMKTKTKWNRTTLVLGFGLVLADVI